VIDVEKGGTIQGLINALNWILDVAVVEHMMEGGTLIVPGRGRMADYPVIDVASGGSIEGLVTAANKLLDLIVWEHMMEGGTLVVPGHGRLADVADVAYYRDMVTIMRDRVATLKGRGMTVAQVKNAKVTRDYDPRWGRNPKWTPDMFVAAIYDTLKPAGRQ
jgi:hypothetical protein